MGAVKAVDGDARSRVPSVFGFFSIGQVPAEPVLRSKGGGDIDARGDERVDEVRESGMAIGEGRRVVADDPDASAFEESGSAWVQDDQGGLSISWTGKTASALVGVCTECFGVRYDRGELGVL